MLLEIKAGVIGNPGYQPIVQGIQLDGHGIEVERGINLAISLDKNQKIGK